MPSFLKSLTAWPGENFNEALKQQLAELDPDHLPLSFALNQGGQIKGEDISFSVIDTRELKGVIFVKTGVFFNEIVGGCNCSEDPVEHNVYCELMVEISRQSGEAEIKYLA